MVDKKLKVLLIVNQCNPNGRSVPLVGFKFFENINKLADVTLVTHERYRNRLKKTEYSNIEYIKPSSFINKYWLLSLKLIKITKQQGNWPLRLTLDFPFYAQFNQRVYHEFARQVIRGDYDIVHAITPMMPRYPYKIVKACQHTPFLLGPVNGGIPFPPGFREKAKEEYAYLNFLRAVGRALIPEYKETYQKTDRILAGSTYTLNLLKNLFKLPDSKIGLFYENGIDKAFLIEAKNKFPKNRDKINLLFVGRLVPYKCADIVIESISKLRQSIQNNIVLTIVGDGSEKTKLENLVQKVGLSEKVNFTGRIPQQETLNYYRQADIFCFPSIREFGGAVVLEAMACGLPCIVANNGGIGEYVTEETGFKIEPLSREYLTQELTDKIKILVEDEQLREDMSTKAVERAREFTWENKAQKIVDIYQEMIEKK
ncbi:MAG: glycosyltransferase family 4 protein [Coleofasciculus sp. C1-SOL-03]|uniref:glycosyltransferase family 4 protein n=1 Tax=Coleofasciculus sp. C1-SOL-03 TaxID=3069522 RepID=UPI0032F8EF90